MTHVFENPWLLLTIAALSLVPAAILRQAKPQWGYRPLLIPLLFAVLGFALDYAVKTDKEQIYIIIRNAQKAAVEGQIGLLSRSVSDAYDDGFHRSKAEFLASAESMIKRASIKKVRFQRIDLTLEDRQAVVEMDTVVHLNPDSQYAAFGSVVFVSLRLGFLNQPVEPWHLLRAGVTSVNIQPMNWGAIR
jgi:hypothetical protein